MLLALTSAGGAHAQASPSAPSGTVSEVVVTGSRIARRDYTSQSPIVTVSSQTLQNTSEVSIDQQLNKLPQFVPGGNQITSAGDVQATPTSNPGAATINLRGLGTNRTLVLLDGRRTQPINANLVVDINTIPSAAIDSVEIITGGAAATYGADAVTGVVNFKLKKNFQGATLDAQYGESFKSDGAEFQTSALLGGNFADNRGNALVGLSYSSRGAVNQSNRPFFSAAYTDPNSAGGDFFPNASGFNVIPYTGFTAFGPNVPSQAAVDAVFGAKGIVPGDVSAFNALYFNRGATTSASTVFAVNGGLIDGKPAPGYTGPLAPGYKILSNGNLGTNTPNQLLSIPLKRYSAFANAHYNLSDNLTLYLQSNFVQTHTTTVLGGFVPAVNQWGVAIPYDAATNGAASGHPVSPEMATLLNSRPDPNASWQLNQELTFLGPRSLDNTTNTYEILGGVKGDVGVKDWTFDLYGSHGKTSTLTVYHGFADQARYQALIALPNYGAGADFNNGLIGRLAHCTTGINPFVTTTVSQDCVDIVQSLLKTTSDLEQDQVELDFQGSLYALPAGDLRFAAGGDYRGDKFLYLPDPAMSTTNITSTSLGIFDAAPAGGSTHVFEGYGELLVPLVKDLPFAKAVNLDASYRYSSYDSGAGGVSTWKASADWDINDWIKVRGGYEVANRAPNVAELFEPSTVVVNPWGDSDPCANTTVAPYGNLASNPNRAKVQALCTALSHGFPITNSFNGLGFYFPLALDQQLGNPNLTSENAKTWTVGAVIKSPFQAPGLSRLTASVDYYNITIDNAIAALTSQTVYQQCLNGLGTNPTYDPNNQYCQLIHRSAAGATDTVIGKFTNLGSIKTAGIDAQLDWNMPVPSFGFGDGSIFANVAFNYLQFYDVVNAPGAPVVHYADTIGGSLGSPPYGAQFKWKLYSTLGYNVGPATVSLGWRHLPSVQNIALATNPNSKALSSPAHDEFDLAAHWAISSKYELRAGLDNVFDKKPEIVGAIPGTTSGIGLTDMAGSYDEIGRRFYVGLKARF